MDDVTYTLNDLRIEIEHEAGFGPTEKIRVKLILGGNVIDEDWCELPKEAP
jgi:hypothetical protein